MPQSPELAGGEGFTFEGAVAALYLTYLLSEGYAPGIDNRTVCRVAFQQRDFGEPLDDVIVDFGSANGELARLSLQAKRSLIISKAKTNTDFREIIRDSWATLRKTNFRRRVDRFGAAVGEVAKDKARALATLCELAREGVTVDYFNARFAPGGNASAEIKSVRDDVVALLNEINGTSCTDAELHEFLAHFVLIEFDFLHAGAEDPPQAITRVRDCLVPPDAAKAPLVWSRLIELARASAGKAGEFDRARLVRSISEVARLRIAPSLRPDLDNLAALARGYVDGIQDDVGGTRLERASVFAELDGKLENSRLIQVRGLPGSGKSVLLRQSVQRALDRGPTLFLKADQLEGRSWISFASAHGLSSAALQDLLVEIGATGSAVLYIDAIDRIEKEHQPIVLDVLLQHVRHGHTVRFSHDIFFEWAFFHVLADRGEDWLGEIRACGEPPAVARVVELLSQWEYALGQDWMKHLARVAASQMRSQWTPAWLLGPGKLRWQNEAQVR